MRLIQLFVILSLTSFWSCQPASFYHKKVDLSPTGWLYDAPKQFEFEISDTTKRYDLTLQIDHKTAYEYQNLYIHLTTFFPNQDSVQQPLSVELADAQGRWFGECSSKRCKVDITLQQNTFFNQLGVHKVMIRQYMRVDPLVDLEALTLSLDEREIH